MQPFWRLPSAPIVLIPTTLDVWRIDLDQPPQITQALYATLSGDEQARAQRFRFEHLRQHFISCHGAVRAILGRYLNVRPQTLVFTNNAYGKPELEGVQFNISHSGALGVLAVAQTAAVGIDIEEMRPNVPFSELATHSFSLAEQQALAAYLPEQRIAAFYACWTRKEAYIKAHGMGLSLPLDHFSVDLSPHIAGAVIAPVAGDNTPWRYWRLPAEHGYASALLCADPQLTPSFWRFG